MKPSDLDFELPADRIAQYPPENRTDARLLHLPARGDPVHRRFAELPRLLRAGDLLVLNDTRVVPCRLRVRRATGGVVEVFLLRPDADGWRALLRPAKRLSAGEELTGGEGAFRVRVTEVGEGEARVSLSGDADEIVERYGSVPLPPYVRRDAEPLDRERYQTVYARTAGAVAAPTAGLHFDEALLTEIERAGVVIARVTLHVGPGTFRPLSDADLARGTLDVERFEVPAETRALVRRTRQEGGRVIAVGTTVVRTLETAERLSDPGDAALSGETDLFVRPPFEFRAIDALVTNFHLPRSSLLFLVAAFAGAERILDAYRLAVGEGYRFYSYGDATFLERAI